LHDILPLCPDKIMLVLLLFTVFYYLPYTSIYFMHFLLCFCAVGVTTSGSYVSILVTKNWIELCCWVSTHSYIIFFFCFSIFWLVTVQDLCVCVSWIELSHTENMFKNKLLLLIFFALATTPNKIFSYYTFLRVFVCSLFFYKCFTFPVLSL
jgi:hypothetical protein